MRRAFGTALLALLVWPAAAAHRREFLIDSQFDIDPGESLYFEIPSKQPEARLEVQFEVQGPRGSRGIRVAVLSERELQNFREKQPHHEIISTAYRQEGILRTRLGEAGGYAVIVDNRLEARRKSRVRLEAVLTTGPDPETLPVTYASPEKRLIVVSVSLAGFLIIVALSGQALWRATRRPPSIPRPASPSLPQWY
ncbi:MAG: hypothetical protein HY236_07750 [Acidobacteria bacterium]|nr:hypothetical protein [Acidobacteriota bacterium]